MITISITIIKHSHKMKSNGSITCFVWVKVARLCDFQTIAVLHIVIALRSHFLFSPSNPPPPPHLLLTCQHAMSSIAVTLLLNSIHIIAVPIVTLSTCNIVHIVLIVLVKASHF